MSFSPVDDGTARACQQRVENAMIPVFSALCRHEKSALFQETSQVHVEEPGTRSTYVREAAPSNQ